MLHFRPSEERAAATSPQQQLRVPVVVVTGYLGSGKTTLIASLLQRPEMAGTAVIVYELAEAGIDQSVIGDAGAEQVVLLSNGCMCCAGGTDLRNAVARLLHRPGGHGASVRRILVETSGAADPAPILRQICFDPVLRSRLRYAGVLTLFDAQNGRHLLARDPVGLRQIGLADRILLTKTDLVDPAAADAARRFLGALNPAARATESRGDACRFVTEAGHGVAELGARGWLGVSIAAEPATAHQSPLSTWSVYGRRAMSWPQVQSALAAVFERYGDDVLRTKGLLWTDDDGRPLAIHGINRHFHRPVRLSGWDGEPMSRVVVIGFQGAAAAAAEISEILGRE